MKIEIKVPSMGESIVEATVSTLIKPSGTAVSADEELIELETDKVNQILYAPEAGTISWNVNPQDMVKVGQVLGYLDSSAAPSEAKEPKPPTQRAKEEQIPLSLEPTLPPPSSRSEGSRMSKESFLADLAAPHLQPASKSATPPASTPGSRNETRKKMSNIRKIIASRLVEALRQTAMLTTFNEVDMSHIIALRESYKESFSKQYGVRLGYMPFFVKAAVSAMKAFPEINALIDGDEIVYHQYFDVSIAISTERGLIVPVVRNCDQLSFADIERAIESFANQAKEGRLSPEALEGGGFTITNGGIYGSLLSTPILNPPQTAILGMHKIMKRPVVINDEIVIRQMMYLALSYDHRLVDGKEAVSFLLHIKNCLEDPSRLLLEI